MKKNYLFGLSLLACIGANAQSMNENFDALSVGDYMGVVSTDFSTWSGTTGGAEDVKVTDIEASSGANSIYFSTTSSSGGPQDVLIPFGGEYSTGTFLFSSMFFVESGKGAYFNFQGETTPGGLYSMNCQLVNDGKIYIDAAGPTLLESTYPSDTWFNLAISVNLNTNDWELLIDGVSQGIFVNPSNQIASADIYPVNANHGGNNIAGFYMDDVTYLHTPYVLPATNLATTEIFKTAGLASQSITPSVKVRNLGTSAITSFDISLTYDGTTITENITGVSIASLATYNADFSDILTLIGGENDIVATVSNINGAGDDDDTSDDEKTQVLNPIVPATGKLVVAEEATGTWCGWCPRGAVYLEQMTDEYPEHFVGIAVHNADPMTVDTYDAGIATYISGYPSLIVDRGSSIDPSAVETDFLERIIVAPKALITVGSDYTDGASTINVSVTAELLEDLTSDYRLALVVIENGVTGTASGYNQVNYYSGGGSGEMGGYELLSNPVPASSMVYDHVARAILPSFTGAGGIFPDDATTGSSFTGNYTVTVGADWDMDNVHFIGMLIAPDTKIDNAGVVTLGESKENGYIVGQTENNIVENSIQLYPNPTRNQSTIELGNIENKNVSVSVFDMSGKLITERNYGILNGAYNLPVNVELFEKGIYNVRIQIGDSVEIKKLIVE